jgi:Ca2+/Na+ antiporter
MWPLITGVFLSLATFWHRVHSWHPDRPNFTEPHFWAALASVALAVGSAFNMPTSDLAAALNGIGSIAATGHVGSIVTTLLMLYGSMRSKTAIAVRRAQPL